MRALLVLAAAVAVVLCLAPAAGATALCEDEPVSEPVNGACGIAYESGTVLEGTATNVELIATMTNECEMSTAKGELTEGPTEAGQPLNGLLTSLTFSGCTCPTEALNTSYSIALSWTKGADGKLTLKSSGKGNPAIKSVCSGVTCVYGASSVTFEVFGGNPAEIGVNVEVAKIEGSFFCKEKAQYVATYQMSAPQGGQAAVANQHTPVTLCSVAVDNPCNANAYPIPTTLEAANEGNVAFELKFNEGGTERAKTVTCTASALVAATFGGAPSWPLRATMTGLTFTTCTAENNCPNVEAKRLNYLTKIDAAAGDQGTWEWEALSNGPPAIFIKCTGLPECTYSATTIPGVIANGAPAKLAITNVSLPTFVAGSTDCRGIVWKTGKYKFTKPEAGNPLSPRMWVRRQGVS
jgi:hypothetical protein